MPFQLLCAAELGNIEELKHLLQEGKEDVNQSTPQGRTPLIGASRCGNDLIVRELLKYAVNVNDRNHWSESALFIASWKGWFLVVKLLLHHHDIKVNLGNVDDLSPLRIASELGHTAVVELLLKHPDTDVNHTDCCEENSLYWASKKGYATIVELLLQHPKIQVPTFFKKCYNPKLYRKCDPQVLMLYFLYDPTKALEKTPKEEECYNYVRLFEQNTKMAIVQYSKVYDDIANIIYAFVRPFSYVQMMNSINYI